MMEALSKNSDAREFVVSTLTGNPEPRVRRQMGQLLVGARPMAGTLLRWLTGELEVCGQAARLAMCLHGCVCLCVGICMCVRVCMCVGLCSCS